jgi:GNAT superfamily N-acetyltransferase
MTAADAVAVAALTAELGYPTGAPQMHDRLAAILARPDDHALLVAVNADDQPIGWIHVALTHTLETEPMATIAGLVVTELARSAGIGRQLLEAGEAWARERSIPTMQVRSRMSRERAHRFYQREGYEHVKTSGVFRKPLE